MVMMGAHNAHDPGSIPGGSTILNEQHIPKQPTNEEIDYILSNFEYDSGTGTLYKYRIKRQVFVKVGAKNNGYLMVIVSGREVYNHHVCWFLHYKIWPTMQIDHKDRNRSNNKIDNLREATYEIQNNNHPNVVAGSSPAGLTK